MHQSLAFCKDVAQDPTRVLIVGASIAGPALAYWLNAYGFQVVVIEKAGSIRDGGYPIDLRGSAVQVAERMGLLPGLEAHHVHSQRISFVDESGSLIGSLAPELITGSVQDRDFEVPRGDLANMLFGLTCESVEYRFNESIQSLSEGRDGVEVLFSSGFTETFDLVVGADGVHSKVRELVFSDASESARPLGFYIAGFKMANELHLSREAIIYNAPGRMAALYAVRQRPRMLQAFLAFAHPYKLGIERRERQFQEEFVAKAFAGAKWKLPEMIRAMSRADDLYFDGVEQVCASRWTKGRVALVGDAAYAPSFLTGQGSSLALVGAYVLASELAVSRSFLAGFEAYEEKMRPYVSANQAAVERGKAGMIPITDEQLVERNAQLLQKQASSQNQGRAAHTAINLDGYARIPTAGTSSKEVVN